MAEMQKSNCPPDAVVDLSIEQLEELKPNFEKWQQTEGLVIGSLHEKDGAYRLGLRQLPIETANKIIQIVNDFYEGENQNASS